MSEERAAMIIILMAVDASGFSVEPAEVKSPNAKSHSVTRTIHVNDASRQLKLSTNSLAREALSTPSSLPSSSSSLSSLSSSSDSSSSTSISELCRPPSWVSHPPPFSLRSLSIHAKSSQASSETQWATPSPAHHSYSHSHYFLRPLFTSSTLQMLHFTNKSEQKYEVLKYAILRVPLTSPVF
ncbi:hypothetical protein BJ165DRAFT_655022 [Panaeolus papilionaceus]|nr:hypothetical protein BJ165DRAFT_655022 [Panaeolus papilionaceus]